MEVAVPFEEMSPRFVVSFLGLIWGLHLMTRAQDYKRIRERFERGRDSYQAEKAGGRERVFRLWGLLLFVTCIYSFYQMYFV